MLCSAFVAIAFGHFLAASLSPLATYLDEIVTGGLLAFLFCRVLLSGRVLPSLAIAFASLCGLFLLSVFWGVTSDPVSVGLQSIIHFKFAIFAGSTILLVRPNHARGTLVLLVWVSVVGAIVHVVSPDTFVALGARERTRYFDWLTRVSGFQLNPNRLGNLMFLGFLFALFTQAFHRRSRPVIVVLALAIVVLTGSRASLLLCLLASAVWLASQRTVAYRVLFVFTLISATALVAWNIDSVVLATRGEFERVSAYSDYIRGLMLYHGIQLAMQHFPFGTGIASYGTVLAQHSPVYYETGIAYTYNFRVGAGLYDSNVGSILGEVGLIGLTLIGWVFLQLHFHDANVAARDRALLLLAVFVGMGMLVQGFLQSGYSVVLYSLALCGLRMRNGTRQGS